MDKTKAWKLYEAGKSYNNKLKPNYYDTVDANWAFFNGDQWRNIDAENMPKPVFNIIKRVITFLVASLTSSKVKIHFEPLTGKEGLSPLDDSAIVSAQVNNLFEKFKMDTRIKDVLFDAAISGDGCAHFYFDTEKKPYGNVVQLSDGTQMENVLGEICMELLDGTNVMFGNANNPDVQSQPYIIISGRAMVEDLKKEAMKHKASEQDMNGITEDRDYNEQMSDSGKIEVEADNYGKALYVIVYKKKKLPQTVRNSIGKATIQEVETVIASKSVEKAYIYEEVDTGLSKYPLAWMNWEKQKNQYHGRAICTGILPNQIFINRMFAMVMYHLMMTAFPKAVYNADFVPEWNNEIGAAIPIYGSDINTNIRNVAGYLEPGNMSNQIVQVIELAMQYTKETLGINDTSLGNTNPDNTSAIIAVQKSAAIPLENPKANLYQWVEDIGDVLLDMMGTYYGLRPLPMEVPTPVDTGQIDPNTGEPIMDTQLQKQIIPYDFSKLKDLWLNVRADVGESSYWSEVASNQTLTNLLGAGHIDIIEFLERTSDELIPQKEELVTQLKNKMEQAQQQAAMQQQAQQQQQMMSQQQNMEQEAIKREQDLALQQEKLDIEREKVRSK